MRVTQTASKGEEVKLIMDVVGTERRDITWKFNGQYIFNLILYDLARCMSKEHVCNILCMRFMKMFQNDIHTKKKETKMKKTKFQNGTPCRKTEVPAGCFQQDDQ